MAQRPVTEGWAMTLMELCRSVAQWLGVPAEYRDAATLILLALADAFILFNFVMLSVLVLIYVFRKLIGFIQARLGPRYTGPRGILQTVADALKLLTKEDIIPLAADKVTFNLAPLIALAPFFPHGRTATSRPTPVTQSKPTGKRNFQPNSLTWSMRTRG